LAGDNRSQFLQFGRHPNAMQRKEIGPEAFKELGKSPR